MVTIQAGERLLASMRIGGEVKDAVVGLKH